MKIKKIYFWKRPILLTIGTGMQNCYKFELQLSGSVNLNKKDLTVFFDFATQSKNLFPWRKLKPLKTRVSYRAT